MKLINIWLEAIGIVFVGLCAHELTHYFLYKEVKFMGLVWGQQDAAAMVCGIKIPGTDAIQEPLAYTVQFIVTLGLFIIAFRSRYKD